MKLKILSTLITMLERLPSSCLNKIFYVLDLYSKITNFRFDCFFPVITMVEKLPPLCLERIFWFLGHDAGVLMFACHAMLKIGMNKDTDIKSLIGYLRKNENMIKYIVRDIQILQIFLNLLGETLKYMKPPSGCLDPIIREIAWSLEDPAGILMKAEIPISVINLTMLIATGKLEKFLNYPKIYEKLLYVIMFGDHVVDLRGLLRAIMDNEELLEKFRQTEYQKNLWKVHQIRWSTEARNKILRGSIPTFIHSLFEPELEMTHEACVKLIYHTENQHEAFTRLTYMHFTEPSEELSKFRQMMMSVVIAEFMIRGAHGKTLRLMLSLGFTLAELDKEQLKEYPDILYCAEIYSQWKPNLSLASHIRAAMQNGKIVHVTKTQNIIAPRGIFRVKNQESLHLSNPRHPSQFSEETKFVVLKK